MNGSFSVKGDFLPNILNAAQLNYMLPKQMYFNGAHHTISQPSLRQFHWQFLVANWKCDWCQFHWLRGYLDVAMGVNYY